MGKTLGITVSNPRTIERLQKLAKQLDVSMPVLLSVMSIAYQNVLERQEADNPVQQLPREPQHTHIGNPRKPFNA